MMRIPLFAVHMPKSVDEPLLKVLHSGFITQGSKVDEFEKKLIPWVDNKNILTLNSGTTALHLALKLADIKPEDEVISTPMTCAATNTPIMASRAKIVWADINPKTGNIDPNSIESLITKKTKAIMCVHYGGYPCDLDEVNAIAKKHRLKVIEDAAHAFGAEYKGRKIGSISDFTEFSFQAIKHLTTVDGGLLACKSERDYKRGKLLRWYGIDREGAKKDMRCEEDIKEAGYKWHMNDVAATIGIEQLNHVGNVLKRHRENAEYFNYELKRRKIKKIKPLGYEEDRLSSYWLYTVLASDREGFVKFMTDAGIQVSQVHSRNDKHSCFKEFLPKNNLPGMDEFSSKQCSIPVHSALTSQDKNFIMNKIEEYQRLK
jgi:dTDP-4-amino-4,6-dideoxygalactose transaminase